MLRAVNVPAVIRNVETIELAEYVRNMDANVSPFTKENSTNMRDATPADILLILELKIKTRANSAIIKPQNTRLFPKIKLIAYSDLATACAARAVIINAKDIHPYTLVMNLAATDLKASTWLSS
jgi:hypothetical protein